VWDKNWDFRAPPPPPAPPTAQEAQASPAAAPASTRRPSATRHLLLIRHGQYHDDEDDPAKRVLTALGRAQAALAGKRLATLTQLPPLTALVSSTMPRALETADLVIVELAKAGWNVAAAPPRTPATTDAAGDAASTAAPPVVLKIDELLVEGQPVPPSPPLVHEHAAQHYWRDGTAFLAMHTCTHTHSHAQARTEREREGDSHSCRLCGPWAGPRIEAAFRRYFHRASPTQTGDSLEVLVCHANVIRYFAVRALQVPPEAWLRISLPHASMTLVSIYPSGHVSLRFLGDAGFLPADMLTT
jgi:serine/threonine-protein phosphatase PGAM5